MQSQQARKAGADDYLTKPFSLGRFLETLTVCLRRRKLGVHDTQTPRDYFSKQAKEAPETASTKRHRRRIAELAVTPGANPGPTNSLRHAC